MFACMYVNIPSACLVVTEAGEGVRPLEVRDGWVTMCVPGTEPGSSAKAAGVGDAGVILKSTSLSLPTNLIHSVIKMGT